MLSFSCLMIRVSAFSWTKPKREGDVYIYRNVDFCADLHLNSMNFMPNVKTQLGGHGVTFEKHFCTTALCCPSRASLLAGKCVQYASPESYSSEIHSDTHSNTNVTDVRVPWGKCVFV